MVKTTLQFGAGLLFVGLIAFTSCEKCATCTNYDNDRDTTLSEKFCEKGHVYDNGLKTYEASNWNCVEE